MVKGPETTTLRDVYSKRTFPYILHQQYQEVSWRERHEQNVFMSDSIYDVVLSKVFHS